MIFFSGNLILLNFSSELYDYLDNNEDHEVIKTDQQICENGVQIQMQKWCVGDAPYVHLVNDPGTTSATTTIATTAAPLPCDSNPCQNSGFCENSVGQIDEFNCVCDGTGFTGAVCEIPIR